MPFLGAYLFTWQPFSNASFSTFTLLYQYFVAKQHLTSRGPFLNCHWQHYNTSALVAIITCLSIFYQHFTTRTIGHSSILREQTDCRWCHMGQYQCGLFSYSFILYFIELLLEVPLTVGNLESANFPLIYTTPFLACSDQLLIATLWQASKFLVTGLNLPPCWLATQSQVLIIYKFYLFW